MRAVSTSSASSLRSALFNVPTWVWALLVVMVPMLIQIVLSWHAFPAKLGETFGSPDPDPWLRLVLVREWLSGGSWYSHLIPNTNTPFGGISSPWTRPLDVVIAFFTQLQPETVDLTLRLARTALILPLLWMGLLLTSLHRNVRFFSAVPSTNILVSVLIASCIPMWSYFGAANADHHALLCVLFTWVMGIVLTPQPTARALVIAGSLLGLQLWISPEALLLIGVVYGWYGLSWLRGDANALPHWSILSVTSALTAILALMVERPSAQWFVPIYDSLSVVYVVILTLTAAAVLSLRALPFSSLMKRILVAGMMATVLIGTILYLFPLAIKGPLVESDAYVFKEFLRHIGEMESPLSMHAAVIVSVLLQPLVAIAILGLCAKHRHPLFNSRSILQLGYFLLGTGALYLLQQRFYYYFYPLVVLVLAPFLAAFFSPDHALVKEHWPARLINHLPTERQALIRITLMALLIGVPLICFMQKSPATDPNLRKCTMGSLRVIEDGSLTRALGNRPLTVFAHTNVGAQILFFTPYHIVASNYHREGKGIEYIWEADRITNPAELRRYFNERKIDALVYCRSPLGADGLLPQLFSGGKAPAWLHPVTLEKPPEVSPEEQDVTPLVYLIKR